MPQLANHLHLPVQSGSDRILALMKRGYTALEYKDKIRRLRAVRPDIAVSSDFIVGFPGETERDFEATLQLIAEVGFDQSFSFIYSRRPGTPAAALPDDGSRTKSSSSAWRGCRPCSTRRRWRSAARMVGTRAARAGRAARAEGRARAGRAHREQPLGQLRRSRTRSCSASSTSSSPRRARIRCAAACRRRAGNRRLPGHTPRGA